MNQNFYSRIFRATLIDVSRQKPSMNRTETLPEDEPCILQFLWCIATQFKPRVPNRHLIEWNTELNSGISTQMLVREEEELITRFKSPIKERDGIGRCADNPVVPAAERLDVCRRVHIGDRDQRI